MSFSFSLDVLDVMLDTYFGDQSTASDQLLMAKQNIEINRPRLGNW